MINEQELNRPYAPPSNVISLLARLRSRNLPEMIVSDYLRDAGIPEGTVSRTLFASRFLRLIDEHGTPTQALRSIASSTDEEYQATLAGLLREAYADVFAVVDPAEDDQARILNVFRRYTPASQRSRQVIFFLGMCREAGIPVLDTPRQRRMAEPRPARQTRTAGQPLAVRGPRQRHAAGINPALEGLINALPPEGTALSAERRQQWLEMAKAALAFVYPEEQEGERGAQERPTP